jgi:hypothetical protein
MKIPEKASSGGLDPESRKKINELIDYLRAAQVMPSSTVAVSRSTTGTHLEVKQSDNGGGTPRWG